MIMMTRFISPKAVVNGYVGDSVILGETLIGSGTLIEGNVIIGHPKEETLRGLISLSRVDLQRCNEASKGARIGRGCIIRSGTVIYEDVTIGDHVKTGHNVLIREGSVIGNESLIGTGTLLDGSVKIGRRVIIQSNAYLPHLTVIGDDVFIAPNVCFTNDPYPESGRLAGVKVEEGAIICANATLLPGIRVGRRSVVGAGSVVTEDVPDESVVFGSPSRLRMTREEFDRRRRIWKTRNEEPKQDV
ncbi:MAG: acyltransferase [Candidatus Bathyarchaeota archaeon B63]|nr:MAG: acyltransferase [Candidatus Bathyarchaeota archaeon B63]